MEIPKLKFTRLWTDPDAFPTVETDETVVRADMQALHNETRDYMNRTLGPTLESVGTLLDDTISGLASQSAARKLGFSPTEGVPETTVQGAIENVQSQLAGAALGSIPDGSITAQQLAASAVTAGKIADGAVATEKLADASVTRDKIATSAVTDGKIAAKAVTQHKLSELSPELLEWVEKTDNTSGYISVSSWPFVRTGHLMPIRWYGGNRTFASGDLLYVKDSTGVVVAKIDIPSAGTKLYFNLKDTANYMLLCTSDEDGYDIPPSFTFRDLPTWSDSPEGTLA